MPDDHVRGHLCVLVVVVFHKVLVRHAFLLLDQNRALDHLAEPSGSRISRRETRIALHGWNVIGERGSSLGELAASELESAC